MSVRESGVDCLLNTWSYRKQSQRIEFETSLSGRLSVSRHEWKGVWNDQKLFTRPSHS
jgi:hypothetical protein